MVIFGVLKEDTEFVKVAELQRRVKRLHYGTYTT